MSCVSSRFLPIVSVLLLALTAMGADAPATSPADAAVALTGKVAHAQRWTAAQLKSDFAKDAKTIQYTLKDAKHAALAVPLLALVNAASPELDPKIKNDLLRFVVVVEGKDGYMATFAITELTAEGAHQEAWLALDLDGKPLADRDTPANLIVPGDQKPERWVHGVASIRVVHMDPVK